MPGLPKTTKTAGYDTSNKPVKLGDIDSDGYVVRYIDPDGLAHESHMMAEFTFAFGRFQEALVAALNRGGGMPSPHWYIERLCSPEYAEAALPWFREQTAVVLMIRRAMERQAKAERDDAARAFPLPLDVPPTGRW